LFSQRLFLFYLFFFFFFLLSALSRFLSTVWEVHFDFLEVIEVAAAVVVPAAATVAAAPTAVATSTAAATEAASPAAEAFWWAGAGGERLAARTAHVLGPCFASFLIRHVKLDFLANGEGAESTSLDLESREVHKVLLLVSLVLDEAEAAASHPRYYFALVEESGAGTEGSPLNCGHTHHLFFMKSLYSFSSRVEVEKGERKEGR
jgi:hypothetical protein